MKMQSTPQFPQDPQATSSGTKAAAGSVPLNFCIILSKDGRIDRLIDRPLEEYLAAIPDASIAWIDYSTRDDAREIEQIAQVAGFTKLPIPKLSTGFYSAYEDYDTELGIMSVAPTPVANAPNAPGVTLCESAPTTISPGRTASSHISWWQMPQPISENCMDIFFANSRSSCWRVAVVLLFAGTIWSNWI